MNLNGKSGELRATIHVKRAATGKVETYELVARTTPEQHVRIIHGAAGAIIGPGSAVKQSTEGFLT